MIKAIRIVLAFVALAVILSNSFILIAFNPGVGFALLIIAIGIPLALAYLVSRFQKSRDVFWYTLIFLLLMAAAWIYMYVNLTFTGQPL
jgi:hypothetical protein